MTVFDPVESQFDAPKAEEAILAFWKEKEIFRRQVAWNSAEACAAEGREHRPFVFYEGPPTANGMPHPGHVLTRVIKDIFLRHRAMSGCDVPRKAGWDTHGLPVEIEVEKILGIEGKEGIEAYGIEPFVTKCKDSVFKYSDLWARMTERIGFWIDLDAPYVTYRQEYIESVWWILKKLWDAGLLYHGHKVVPYCPRCGTALSSHEVGQGYKEVADPSVYVAFALKEDPKTSLLAWTTTPWTLPGNVALAVGEKYDYDRVRVGEERLILASALREAVLGKIPHEVEATVKGRELVGLLYEPLFTFAKVEKPAFRVVAADFVGLETGTGIVHMAPAFGEDDYRIAQENDLPVVNLVRPDGTFSEAVAPWAGVFVKDADKGIVKALKERGRVLRSEQYKHEYPFCWRCDSPLLYYARPTWYIRTTSVKDRMLENNARIDWRPEHIRDGRFGNFLAANIDWALSRERYWGTPLPIWQCQGCSYQTAIGSMRELLEHACDRTEPVELHKPWVDGVLLNCPVCSSTLKRVPEVIDCWFDSGAMPLAQWGYPHREGSTERLAAAYPAAFITEAIDQTRGWFYSLLAIATLLKTCAERQEEELKSGQRKPGEADPALRPFLATPFPAPYRRCLVLGHVCDEQGYKMSKSKGNYLDPWEVMNENGADALRWYFFSSNNPWTSVRFFKEAVRDAQKDFLIRLRNVQQFFVIYANIDGFDPREGAGSPERLGPGAFRAADSYVPPAQRAQLDRWILSKLASATRIVGAMLEGMDIYAACRALSEFVDALSNWYVRRSRDRFWSGEKTADKSAAYWTLYECLTRLSLLLAPFTPFAAERLYQELARKLFPSLPESVHLHPWPDAEAEAGAIDAELEAQMALVREVASLGLSARAGCKIKVRQPLREAVAILADPQDRVKVEPLAGVICEELNVKSLAFAEEAEQYVHFEVRPNFKTLGPRLGGRMKACAAAVAKLDAAKTSAVAAAGGRVAVEIEGERIELGAEELDIRVSAREGYVAAQGLRSVVVLDATLTPALLREGLAREAINRVQNLRKEMNLAYEARIDLRFACEGAVREAVQAHEALIRGETLAASLSCDFEAIGPVAETEIDKSPVRISIRPAG